jgi:prepilin-type N-terminal cleavage/methylation domain-containing protein
MVTRHRLTGFTLVELLISLAILGMIFGVSSYAFSMFTRFWDGRLGDVDRSVAQFQRLELVRAALENSVSWVVKDRNENVGMYFLGREEGLTVVSEDPIYSEAGLAVVRLFREPDGLGRWRLVYEEAPLDETPLRDPEQELPFRHRVVVLQGLSKLEFSYFAWPDLNARMSVFSDDAADTRQWWREYDGLKRQQQPERVRLQLGESFAVVDLPSRSDVVYSRIAAD